MGSLGLSAVLAYGMLDGLTSAAAFVLAFLAYEAQTGVNLAHNPAQLPKVMLLVWASKHVTRPFRWAAVAALAPLTDRLLNALQQRLRLQSRGAAFALAQGVGALAAGCHLGREFNAGCAVCFLHHQCIQTQGKGPSALETAPLVAPGQVLPPRSATSRQSQAA